MVSSRFGTHDADQIRRATMGFPLNPRCEGVKMDRPTHLLAIIDPTATEHPALQRARQLALAFGARLELFVCYQPFMRGAVHVDERALERLANGFREQGIETTTDECSAPTIDAGILSKVLRSRPSMVIKDTHPHSLLRRTVLSNTDWQLIRACPAPVLFVRPGEWHNPPRIAAAVDVAMPGEKPAAQDHALLSIGESFALATNGQLHAVHAYTPVSPLAAVVTRLAVPMAQGTVADQIIADNELRARQRFDDLIIGHPVAEDRRHLLSGEPGEVLPEFVRTEGMDLMVMGAFSRGWMYNVFVGSTTERLMDFLPCDILVMKPERFTSPFSLPASSRRDASHA